MKDLCNLRFPPECPDCKTSFVGTDALAAVQHMDITVSVDEDGTYLEGEADICSADFTGFRCRVCDRTFRPRKRD